MDIFDLMKNIKLWDYFPRKLKRLELFSANKYSCFPHQPEGSQSDPGVLMLKYVNGIVHFDRNSRFNKGLEQTARKSYKEKRRTTFQQHHSSDIHPLDISTALFLCCDNISRQDLVLRCWGCKHAFPIVIKTEQLEPPMLYIWPMRSLHYSRNVFDKPILEYEMKAVSALRFSKQDCSKANLLNVIISKSEKVHSAFFHRDCTGSSKQKSEICEGMIEALPVMFEKNGPVMFFNLRGNCVEHLEQKKFLVMTSDVIILLCKIGEINLLHEFANTCLENSHAFLVIVFTDLDAADDNNALHSKIESLSETLPIENYVIPYKNLSHPELIDDIWNTLNISKSTCTQGKLIASARSNYFEVDLDSFEETLKIATTFGDRIVQSFGKSTAFPLQGNESLQWSKADFEIFRLRHWERNATIKKETVSKYREELELKKMQLRLKQMEMIQKDEISITREFIETIDNAQKGKGLDLDIFLQGLKLRFDNATRTSLKTLFKHYVTLMDQLKLEKSNTKGIEEQLLKIDNSYNKMYLSLTVFIREMGQIFEIIVTHRDTINIPNTIFPETLTEKAVALLMKGYQVDLMDGRTNDVPIKWIQGILLELHNQLKRVRIKVITVLGAQSSGKSTLLNIMFGSQFDVSSGRCTRGVQMHLVKVSDDAAKEYLVDYLIILDTEGLFSTSVKLDSGERNHEERELATFVIGLSHVTILNIMGENISYLSDILPISVRAFLRMDLAGLNSKCVLLRQNVDSTQKDKMRRQTYSLENTLDTFTAAACDLERVPRRRFKNIIRFDILEDDYYFPTLNENNNELEIISPLYSKTAMQLKQHILADQDATGTILDWHCHIGYLWSAIKRDTFVYDFRNTVEMEARAVMDKRICFLQRQIRRELQNNTAAFKTQIANCDSIRDLFQIESNYHAQMRKMANEQEQLNYGALSLGVSNAFLSKAIQKLRDDSLRKLQNTIDDCKLTCDAQFERDFSYRKIEMKIVENDVKVLNQIDEFIQRNLANSKQFQTEVRNITDTLFEGWSDSLWTTETSTQHLRYEDDALNCIFSTFFAHRAKVDSILQVKGLMERNMDDFLRDMHTSEWSSHVANHGQQKLAQEMIQDSLKYVARLVNEIKSMKLFYYTDVYRDILLEVRNHKHLYEGRLHIRPSFEIVLAISLCGEFIKKLQAFETDKTILSDRLMKNTESYFKSKCRAQLNYETNTNEAVEAFTNIITEELLVSILKMLPQDIATFLKKEHPFLESKQGLLCHTWITLLQRKDVLLDYLNSPITAFEGCVIKLFDDLSETDCGDQVSQMQILSKSCVEKNLGVVTERLFNASRKLEINRPTSDSSTMVTCVDMIYDSLGDLLTLEKIRTFAYDKLYGTDSVTIISRLAANFDTKPLVSILAQRLNDSGLRAHFELIRQETVREILENLLGCKATCPFCGELCCIGQEGHEEEHKALMHKPTASQDIISKNLSEIHPHTCWDEKLQCCESEPATDDWVIPSDVTVEDNSFWKFMFATHIEEITPKEKQERIEIPTSWKILSKSAENDKLRIMMERINEL